MIGWRAAWGSCSNPRLSALMAAPRLGAKGGAPVAAAATGDACRGGRESVP